MKNYLLGPTLFIVSVTISSAETFSSSTGGTREATTARPSRHAPIYRRGVSGVLPRAIRGGNPFQMFNPRAPAKYGTAEQSVSFDPNIPGKWNGIKIFEIRF